MNTLLVLTLIASAYGFVVTILLLRQKALAKSYMNNYLWIEREIVKIRENSIHIKADRDQLAQALKETQDELNFRELQCLELENRIDKLSETIKHTKVRRDPKTGRMVSAKSK